MDKLTVHLTKERETKGTWRFKEDEDKGGMPPVIGTLYIQKWAVANPVPERIKVLIEEVK